MGGYFGKPYFLCVQISTYLQILYTNTKNTEVTTTPSLTTGGTFTEIFTTAPFCVCSAVTYTMFIRSGTRTGSNTCTAQAKELNSTKVSAAIGLVAGYQKISKNVLTGAGQTTAQVQVTIQCAGASALNNVNYFGSASFI